MRSNSFYEKYWKEIRDAEKDNDIYRWSGVAGSGEKSPRSGPKSPKTALRASNSGTKSPKHGRKVADNERTSRWSPVPPKLAPFVADAASERISDDIPAHSSPAATPQSVLPAQSGSAPIING